MSCHVHVHVHAYTCDMCLSYACHAHIMLLHDRYTGYEPTSMRAIRARYDPYKQTRGRVEQLQVTYIRQHQAVVSSCDACVVRYHACHGMG